MIGLVHCRICAAVVLCEHMREAWMTEACRQFRNYLSGNTEIPFDDGAGMSMSEGGSQGSSGGRSDGKSEGEPAGESGRKVEGKLGGKLVEAPCGKLGGTCGSRFSDRLQVRHEIRSGYGSACKS